MKKNIIIVASIVAATALLFSSCSKSEVVSNESNAKTVEFFASSIDTKTAFTTPEGSTYPTLWTVNDSKVKILQNVGGTPVEADVAPSVDFKTAKFTASIDDDGTGSYVFYAASPASAMSSYTKSDYDWLFYVKANQTPLAGSVDESAQVLFAKSTTYSPSFPTSVSLNFSHLTAYGKVSFSNLGLSVGETIKKVTLTTASTPWVGTYHYHVADKTPYSEGEITAAGTASKELILNTTSASDVWFACAPVDLGGETVTVVVTTNMHTFTKSITIPSTKKFTSGGIASFTVNMSTAVKADAPAYTLEPTAGSESGYATSEDIAISGITWNVTGNSTMVPWRIGGKNLSGVDRAIYSKTAITENISKIVITHGAASSVTVNSMKVYVCSSAAGAAKSTPTDVVASFTPTFAANDDVTITKTDATSWAGCYYRIVYNVTIGGSNKFIAFTRAKFFE